MIPEEGRHVNRWSKLKLKAEPKAEEEKKRQIEVGGGTKAIEAAQK